MPLFLILLGLALILTAVRNKEGELAAILKDDFTSSNNFIAWLGAFAALGVIASASKSLRPATDAFSLLLLTVMMIGNRGFFEQFERQALR